MHGGQENGVPVRDLYFVELESIFPGFVRWINICRLNGHLLRCYVGGGVGGIVGIMLG